MIFMYVGILENIRILSYLYYVILQTRNNKNPRYLDENNDEEANNNEYERIERQKRSSNTVQVRTTSGGNISERSSQTLITDVNLSLRPTRRDSKNKKKKCFVSFQEFFRLFFYKNVLMNIFQFPLCLLFPVSSYKKNNIGLKAQPCGIPAGEQNFLLICI